MLSQNEYNVTKQNQRDLNVKINLLNFKFQIVDELSAVVLSYNFTENANSEIRRTCSITLIPNDDSFKIEKGSKIWLDKYIQIYVGIENMRTKETEWTNMGIYIINNPSQTYDEVNNTITLQCVDLMAKMTGLRNGNLEGYEHIIPQNSSVREAIIATIKLAGFDKYVVDECTIAVPYDIKISSGGTIIQLLNELRDILPQYQMYFDEDGIFHYNLIPSGENEQILIKDDIWENTLIGYTVNTSFDSLKNVIEVWGKTHDIKNYGGNATISGDTYVISISTISKLRNNLKIGFTAPSKINNPYINLNNYGKKALKNEDETFPILSTDANKYYVAKYIQAKDYFLFMGEVQPHSVVKEENSESPFYIKGTIGEIRIVFEGGEYDNIYTDSLAYARAKFELYRNCRLQDNITINCIPIYWAKVNTLIEVTLPDKKEKEVYIIKNINTAGGETGTQSIQCMKYYPFYPSV